MIGSAAVGRFADRYSLEREIGLGSSARVFLAQDEETGRWVAVKVLMAPDRNGTSGGSHA